MLSVYKVIGFFSIGFVGYGLWRSTLSDEIQIHSKNITSEFYRVNTDTTSSPNKLSGNEKKIDYDLQKNNLIFTSPPKSNTVEESNLPGSIPEFSNDDERLNWARKIIFTGTPVQRLCALQAIFDNDPSEAAKNLIESIQLVKTSDADTTFLVQSILFMENQKSPLQHNDLVYFYDNGNADLQKTVAKVLADRGDPSLLNTYLTSASAQLHSDDPQVRATTLREFGSLNNPAIIPFALESLNDVDPQVKIDALEIVAIHGTKANVATIQKLVTDADPRVQLQAQRTLNNLKRERTLTNTNQGNSEQVAQLPAHGYPTDMTKITSGFSLEISGETNSELK